MAATHIESTAIPAESRLPEPSEETSIAADPAPSRNDAADSLRKDAA